MAKKPTTPDVQDVQAKAEPEVHTAEVVAYNLAERGFFSVTRTRLGDDGEWSPLPPGHALVRDEAHHRELLAVAGDRLITVDAEGYACAGEPFQAEIPPGLFASVAEGQRRQAARSFGHYSIAEALALMSDAADVAKLRAWAQEHVAATNRLAPLVASGELLPSAAIAQLPVLGGGK